MCRLLGMLEREKREKEKEGREKIIKGEREGEREGVCLVFGI